MRHSTVKYKNTQEASSQGSHLPRTLHSGVTREGRPEQDFGPPKSNKWGGRKFLGVLFDFFFTDCKVFSRSFIILVMPQTFHSLYFIFLTKGEEKCQNYLSFISVFSNTCRNQMFVAQTIAVTAFWFLEQILEFFVVLNCVVSWCQIEIIRNHGKPTLLFFFKLASLWIFIKK